MTVRAVVFDLDGTLVDSSALDALRTARRWKDCAARLGECAIFPGLPLVLRELRDHKVPVAIVTSSVSFYAERLLSHHHLPYDKLVAYHDALRRKPHPDPVHLALARIGITNPAGVIGIGDAAIDQAAYHAAGLRAVGAGWSMALDRSAPWDVVAHDAAELRALFKL